MSSVSFSSVLDNELHTRMKAGSEEEHDYVENLVEQFICAVTEDLYKILLAQIYYVYRALEEEGEKNCDHEIFQAVYFPTELSRVAALEEDLDFFYGGSRWENEIEMMDVTRKYVERIHEVGLNDPALLVAHFYTRYLGDLSGGQILKYRYRKALGLGNKDEKGVQFYTFSEITSINKFKNLFKNRLNAVEADNETYIRIEREVIVAFQFNIALYEELRQMCGSKNGYDAKKPE